MNKKIKYIIILLFNCLVTLFFYTFLHEGGHALVTIICGGRINKIVLGINAHVETSGANFNKLSEAFFNTAGALLPVLFLIIALAFYRPQIKSIIYHSFYGILSLCIMGSLLAWVIVPSIALFSVPPEGDDVTKFLNITGFYPLIVVFSALLIIVLLACLILKKGLFEKIKSINYEIFILNSIKQNKQFLVRLIIGIILGAVIAVVGGALLLPKPIFKKSLSMEVNSTTKGVKLPFSVEKSKIYSMSMALKARGILTDIQIYSSNGTMVYENVCEWFTLTSQLNLKKGNYRLILTFLQEPIAMQEYFKLKGYKFNDNDLMNLKKIFSTSNLTKTHSILFKVTIK